MYAERRLAFEKRIKQIIDDHCNAYPGATKKSERMWWDLQARILSALEDAYKVGLGEFQEAHRAKIDGPPEKD